MNAPMDDQRLDEILDRANAATKGPWCTDAWEIYQGTEYVPGISFWIGETCRGTADLEQDSADASFIAAARTDVPELVAEVVALRARVAELEAYEQLSPQQCPKGLHADWLIDSEYAHACPWCRIDELSTAHSNAIKLINGLECDLSAARARVAELEAQLPAVQEPENPFRPCGCPKRFDRHAWGCPTVPEDPHNGPNHHDYTLGRDLPFIPRQVTGRCPNGHTFEDCTCGGTPR